MLSFSVKYILSNVNDTSNPMMSFPCKPIDY